VTSSLAGIDCGSDCSESYPYNTAVALTATPAAGSVFDGWSGACTGTGACNVTMDQARSVTATFSVANHELTVSLSGAGSGSVMSSPAGIDCGSDCSESYSYNTVVTLTATPATGSVFDGWSGDCTGTDPCNVTMDQARSVTATFSVATFDLTVNLAGPGSGSVSSSPAGIDCGSDCSETYEYNTEVTLTATPAVGSVFGAWGGACSGTDPCVVTMDQARSVTATFEVGSFVLSVAKAGDGAGTVTSSPAGINCGADCSESYAYNTAVTLTATPYPVLSAFTGWSGACSGTGPCNVTMDQARSVTATFDDLGLDFHTVTPCRVIDTRLGAPLTSGVTTIINVSGTCGIPVTAKAVSVNLTAIPGTKSGSMVLFPGDAAVPNTVTTSFNASNNRANNSVMGLATNGDGTLAVRVTITGGGTINMVLDVNGYFE
ncbi:MAG TPA: InlB B-repeat-containing protein, partial [Thermoanaerobaculia bacterium]|nr:InlB B-repeat-containing protein [Thermoanaerobaculia bacterium]